MTPTTMRKHLLLHGAALALLAAAAPARAEQAKDGDEAGASTSGDIVVTAQRRSERLQDVPMSITALSSDILERSGVTNTTDIARVTPGVTMAFYGGFLQPAIRGITSTGANIGENSNVATYIDGIYQPQQIATLIDLPDVEQIEVLKGPQGALYGQNATGGAILITSKAPSFTTTGKFSASYGNFNDVQLRGYLSGGLGDGIAASITGSYQNRDGFRRHVITNERDLGVEAYVVRGKLLVEPSDAARLTVSGFYSHRKDSANYAGFAINGNSIGYAPNLAGLSPFFAGIPVPASPRKLRVDQFSAEPGAFTKIRSYGGSLRGEFDLLGGTLTSSTGYVNNEIGYLADIDAAAPRIIEARAEPLSGDYFVHDTSFVSGGSGPLSFLGGVFYLKGKETFLGNVSQIFLPNLPPATKINLNLSNTFGQVRKEIYAVYGEVTFKPTEQLTITAGGRYTDEKQRSFSGASPSVNTEYAGGAVHFRKFTPRVNARYAVTDEINVYASWGRGFKSGVINTNAPAGQQLVKPETIDAFEGGIKGRIGSNLRVNLAAFYYDYKNLQAVSYCPTCVGSTYLTQNAATARVKGADFDFTLDITPEFSINGGAAILDAEYVNFPDAQIYLPNATNTGNLSATRNLSGGQLLRSPKFSGNLGANYAVETSAGKLAAFASLYYNSGFGMELSNRIRQGHYATVDAEASFAPSGLNGARFVVWGKNLTDKAIYSQVLASNLSDLAGYAPPRTFGVRAEYAF